MISMILYITKNNVVFVLTIALEAIMLVASASLVLFNPTATNGLDTLLNVGLYYIYPHDYTPQCIGRSPAIIIVKNQ